MFKTTVLGMLALAVVAPQFGAATPALVTLAHPPYFIPPETFSANILGVDSEGRTTYAIAEDVDLGTGVLTATLVQGADHAMYTVSADTVTFGFDCALSGKNAICSGTDSSSHLVTTTEVLGGSMVLNVASLTVAPSQAASQSANKADPSTRRGSSAAVFGAMGGTMLVVYLYQFF
ncbi:hypothetical protein C8R47DRAFT_656571 [Mycena vitilis]|nr:hypothetical protein C8R47DRAFT_656571 [Mycena vitilis]